MRCARDFTLSRARRPPGESAIQGPWLPRTWQLMFTPRTLAIGMEAAAQGKPPRIDVHPPISPPSWLGALKKAGVPHNPPRDDWSVAKSLEDMDKGGTATAIVSPTNPQLNFLANDSETAARLA